MINLIRADATDAVEDGVQGQSPVVLLRLAQPPVGKNGKFLRTVRFPAVQGQPARGLPVTLSFAEQPEIARAEKRANFIPLVRIVQLIQQAEPGVTRIRGDLVLNVQRAVIEKVLHEPDGLHMCRREFIDVNRFLVEVARMEKFHAKRQAIHRPQGLVVPEFNLAILVIIEIFLPQHLRQIGARRVERLARPFESALRHIIQIDLG